MKMGALGCGDCNSKSTPHIETNADAAFGEICGNDAVSGSLGVEATLFLMFRPFKVDGTIFEQRKVRVRSEYLSRVKGACG
jgi:hypothetical protein